MFNYKLSRVPKFFISVFIPLIIGYLGSIITISEISTWYASLSKPSWAPPNWLFGPVWTTLYVLMGISLFLIWCEGFNRKDVKFALLIFGVQLILNLLWSILFFSFHSLFGSFILILILWIAIFANIIVFFMISRPSGLLLVPYLIWVSIASYLNYSIYLINH
ncbi:MAG: tryptophan-rich sensory protein [Methanobacterium sp.]|nr:tryptophan-rich sensory protein [Methanobacterium sp.]